MKENLKTVTDNFYYQDNFYDLFHDLSGQSMDQNVFVEIFINRLKNFIDRFPLEKIESVKSNVASFVFSLALSLIQSFSPEEDKENFLIVICFVYISEII